MFPQILIRHNIGNIIEIPNELNAKVFTYLSNNVAIGSTTIPVDNAIDFTSGAIITLLGSIGAENAEFGYVTSHTDQSFTVTATKQPHNRGDLITQVNYDQVVISKSSTIDGSYSVFQTITLFLTQSNTVAFDSTGLTTDYYKLQWKNSVTGELSSYSEPISVVSYPENSAGYLISSVLKAMGIQENDTRINTPFCLSAINDARKYVKTKLYGIRMPWRSEFEYRVKVLAGSNYVELPDDVDFEESDRSVLACRFIIGNVLAPFNLKYIDKKSWNQVAFNVGGAITSADASIAATTLNVNSAGDFVQTNNPNAVAYVATTEYDQDIMQIEYSGVDLINNQLTGVTGITRAIPSGTQIWVTPTIAQPITYTVYPVEENGRIKGRIVFDRIIPDSMQGNNLYIDYYKKINRVENLYDNLPEPYRDIYEWYLRWAIKYRKDITLSSSDPDLVKFEELVQALFNNLYTGQDTLVVTG